MAIKVDGINKYLHNAHSGAVNLTNGLISMH